MVVGGRMCSNFREGIRGNWAGWWDCTCLRTVYQARRRGAVWSRCQCSDGLSVAVLATRCGRIMYWCCDHRASDTAMLADGPPVHLSRHLVAVPSDGVP